MIAYIVRRSIATVLLVLIVSAVTFVIFFVIPRIAGQSSYELAARYVGRSPTPEAVLAVEKKLGFDKPLIVQYGNFVKGIVVGAHYNNGPDTDYCPPPCFGYSFKTQQPVWPLLLDRFPVTFSLAIGSAVLWVIGGVATGVVSALKRGSIFDRLAMGTALAGVSLPVYFTGLLASALFVYKLPIFPDVTYVGFLENPLQWAYHLVLPWVTLAFLNAALYARLTRAGMLETMNEDYIRTARAKGLTERTVVMRHGLRSALTPILTIFGLDFGILLGGAVLTESTFSLPGLGRFAIDAIAQNDFPEVMGVTMLVAFFVAVCNLVVDILYAVVDPRVRY